MSKRITFEDNGQDFLTFDIDNDGYIKEVKPFQGELWKQYRVSNYSNLSVGGFVHLQHLQAIDNFSIKHKIQKIERILILRKSM